MSERRRRVGFLLIVMAHVAALSAAGQTDGFGTIDFPTSGSAQAQPLFLRGVAALHSFEYEDALDAFRQAQAVDPRFAMAYWGEAMAHNQTLWLREDIAEARRALSRLGSTRSARAASAPTAREKAYLEAVEVLVGDGQKAARDLAYADSMRRLNARYPDDNDAACFHALALLATVQRGITGLAQEGEHRHALVGSAVQQQVAAILQSVLKANPGHPGAAHYLIHTWDDPDHAALALPVARTYARIAPAASHALHMPAHIFLQLGQWAEAAASDEAAFSASDAWVRRRGLPLSMRSYHSLSWLQYEYLQQGRYRKAAETLDAIAPVARETDLPTLKGIAASMRARDIVERRRWTGSQGQTRFDNTDELFAIGVSAARSGDATTAGMAREELARRAVAPETGDRRPVAIILEQQLAALIELAAGRGQEATALMERAVEAELRLPPPLGPPVVIKPANELYGETLLEQGRAGEAVTQFETALKRYPNRSASVLGLARALAAIGRHDGARVRYREFLENWRQADADLPELAEARRAVDGAGTSTSPDADGLREGRLSGRWPFALAALAMAAGAVAIRRRRTRIAAPPLPVARRAGKRSAARRR